MAIILLKEVNKFYNKGKDNEIHVLKDFTFEVNPGEMVAVMGQSGSGKSTLLNLLGCMDMFDDGEYILDGQLMAAQNDKALSDIRSGKVGFVFQDFALIEEEDVLENVRTPLYFNSKVKYSEMSNYAKKTIEQLGISELTSKKVNQLSGGQKQRVAIARAIVSNPIILLADEPTGSLDSETSMNIMNIFKQMNQEGMTIIIVTHDVTIAEQCNRIVKIIDGRNQ